MKLTTWQLDAISRLQSANLTPAEYGAAVDGILYSDSPPDQSRTGDVVRRGSHIAISVPMLIFVVILAFLASSVAIQTVRGAQADADLATAETKIAAQDAEYQRGRADAASEGEESLLAKIATLKEYKRLVIAREESRIERNNENQDLVRYAIKNGEYFDAVHMIRWLAAEMDASDIAGDDLDHFLASQFQMLIQKAMAEHQSGSKEE